MISAEQKISQSEPISIFKSWSPVFQDVPGGDMNEYRDYILEHVLFSKVLRALKLRPENSATGRYTHKMICPFKFHKNGRERTGSFRFDDKRNVFACYGCNENGNILKFLTLYCGGCEQFHLKKLAGFAGLLDNASAWILNEHVEEDNEANIRDANNQNLFDAGLMLREYLRALKDDGCYMGECEWVDKMFVRLDKYFDEADDVESTKDILVGLTKTIERRKKKYTK